MGKMDEKERDKGWAMLVVGKITTNLTNPCVNSTGLFRPESSSTSASRACFSVNKNGYSICDEDDRRAGLVLNLIQ